MFQNFITEFTAVTATGLSARDPGLVFLGTSCSKKLPPAAVATAGAAMFLLLGL